MQQTLSILPSIFAGFFRPDHDPPAGVPCRATVRLNHFF